MRARTRLTRRQFIRRASGVALSFSCTDTHLVRIGWADSNWSPKNPGDAVEGWLRIEPDGTVRTFTGKVELGMGIDTAFAQIVAEELDVEFEKVVVLMGDTHLTPNQGGVGASTSIYQGGKCLRAVAAAARDLLLQLAARQLNVPKESLYTARGVVQRRDKLGAGLSYAELTKTVDLRGSLQVKGQGFSLEIQPTSELKDPKTYSIIGTSVPRRDIALKVMGGWQYVTDVRLPGMLHGRVVRPPTVGAELLEMDDRELSALRGYVMTVTSKNFVGVIAETEWAAVSAMSLLKLRWSGPQDLLCSQEDLYEVMSRMKPVASKETERTGDAPTVFDAAPFRVTARYEYGFQSHASMGPGCAVADVHVDGLSTFWSGTQKPHGLKVGLSKLLGVSESQVRVIWVQDAGSYGRGGFDDVAADAALLSRAADRPVRVQWMRADMTAWGAKGPPVVCDLAAGLNLDRDVVSFQFTSRAFSGNEVFYQPDTPGNFLACQLSGIPNTTGSYEFVQLGSEAVGYEIANVLAVAHVLPPLCELASPLRGAHFRDPEGFAATFATESFVDEIASASAMDPLKWRLEHLKDERLKLAISAGAEKFKWRLRGSVERNHQTSGVACGQGVAVALRNGTRVVTLVEIEVEWSTGLLRVKRIVCVHDCGLIVNPEALRATVYANLIQSMSRTLKEEVAFDKNRVLSVDWRSYPVAMVADVPAEVEVVLINQPSQPSTGAGEPATRPTAAAIGNALFDATGVRLRRGPLTQARVQQALAAAAGKSG
jgi:nicotinate dehydrogenase subunit B